jgi:hypothetical protein
MIRHDGNTFLTCAFMKTIQEEHELIYSHVTAPALRWIPYCTE